MSNLPHFTCHQPQTLEAALDLLARHRESAKLLAGGTELIPRMRAGQYHPEHLISLNRIADLDALELTGGSLVIGGGTKLAQVGAFAPVRSCFPALATACSRMATPQIRNMGTVAGNLVNGSPCADTAGPLLIYDARIAVVGPGGRRLVELADFFLDAGKVAIEPDEILASIEVPRPAGRTGSAYLRHSARSRVDIACASAAGLVRLADDGTIAAARIALGSVAPTPLRCREGESALVGQLPSAELLEQAAAICAAAARPIDDVRASAAYRGAVLPVLVKRVLEQASRDARQDSQDGGASS